MFLFAVAIMFFTDGCPYHNCKLTSARLGLLAHLLPRARLRHDGGYANGTYTMRGQHYGKGNVGCFLGLQGVALPKEVMAEEFVCAFKKCNRMSAVRKVANK